VTKHASAEHRARTPTQPPAAAKKKKTYNGLGVHSWQDVGRALAKGGWSLTAQNNKARWTRVVPQPAADAAAPGARPLVQHLFLACSPSDNFHGPQKAATTMRKLDREREAFLRRCEDSAAPR
jgi:hypothetical protein